MKKELFGELLSSLTPTPRESAQYDVPVKRIQKRLLSKPEIASVVPIGSRRRGTALAGFSDFDLLVVFHRSAVTRAGRIVTSETALKRLRAIVKQLFPKSEIKCDKQAIVLNLLSSGCKVDLVPAFFAQPGTDFEPPARNYPVYRIPDGGGDWIPTSPHAYDTMLKEADERSGHKLRNVSRLLKYWTHCYSSPATPMSSFSCELLLVNTHLCKPGRSYGHCLWWAFKLLASKEYETLADPLSLSSGLRLARKPRQRLLIRKRARKARILARRALRENEATVAIQLWRNIFNRSS